MEHYASEQEQVEQIRRWWKENGKSLIFGLVVGIGGLAGYRYWDANQTARAENASLVYEQFLNMANARQFDDARQTGQAIIDNYPDSTYAHLSALLLAKMAADTGDYAKAKALLESLTGNSADAELSQLARARLARIHLAEGDADAAQKLLDAIPPVAGEERFAELRGDVFAANGDNDQARGMYLKALAQAEALGLERDAIQLKLDNLASGIREGSS